jgi:hypothetical protein
MYSMVNPIRPLPSLGSSDGDHVLRTAAPADFEAIRQLHQKLKTISEGHALGFGSAEIR